MKMKKTLIMALIAVITVLSAIPAAAATKIATKETTYEWHDGKWVKWYVTTLKVKGKKVTKGTSTFYSDGKKDYTISTSYKYSKGIIKEVTEKKEGKLYSKKIYNKKGKPTVITYYDNDKKTSETKYKYKSGRVSKETSTYFSEETGEKYEETTYTNKYDGKGRIKKQTYVTTSEEGDKSGTITYKYNKKGRLKETKDVCKRSEDGVTFVTTETDTNTKWDKYGNVTAYKTKNADDEGGSETRKYKVKYTYKKGRLSSEVYSIKAPGWKDYEKRIKVTYKNYKTVKALVIE